MLRTHHIRIGLGGAFEPGTPGYVCKERTDVGDGDVHRHPDYLRYAASGGGEGRRGCAGDGAGGMCRLEGELEGGRRRRPATTATTSTTG